MDKTGPSRDEPSPPRCAKCGGAVERVHMGYLVMEGRTGPTLPVRCVKGKSRGRFWRGRPAVDVEAQYRIRALRCASCGFLELYADEEPDA